MFIFLADELVHFLCEDKQAEHQLGLLFFGWPWHSNPVDYRTQGWDAISLELQIVGALDRQPDSMRLVFADEKSQTSVQQSEEFWRINFGSDAVANIPFNSGAGAAEPITVQVATSSLAAARLEDIIFSSLAPILRRRGIFMMHAFAAEKDGKALLLVGESGSGKTTTGLSLISQGWSYLANDVVLIGKRDGTILAWPTPGGIGLDQDAYNLLPGLMTLPDSVAPTSPGGISAKRYFPAKVLAKGWGADTPVTRILFPKITKENDTALVPLTRSVTLARLLEASVDRWDAPSLDEHVQLLELLSRQAEGFDLWLSREPQQLSDKLT